MEETSSNKAIAYFEHLDSYKNTIVDNRYEEDDLFSNLDESKMRPRKSMAAITNL